MAAAAGLEWPEIADWDEDRLRTAPAPECRYFCDERARALPGSPPRPRRARSSDPCGGGLISTTPREGRGVVRAYAHDEGRRPQDRGRPRRNWSPVIRRTLRRATRVRHRGLFTR